MNVNRSMLPVVACLLTLSCGGKQSKEQTPKTEPDTATEVGPNTADGRDQKVDDAKKAIRNWLSTDIAVQVQELAKKMGKDLGSKLASDPEVLGSAKTLTGALLKDKSIKPKLDRIEEKATQGFTKKLTLGFKALKAGGIDEFKAKIGADAQRVGTEVLNAHIQNDILKDPRFSALLKEFSPVLKLQGQVAAIALQENLSPKVNSMILSMALRFATATGSDDVGTKVDNWIKTCDEDATARIETLLSDISALKSVHDAMRSLAKEVLTHERTKKELVQMFNKLLDNGEVNTALTGVYEAAAFEKGDDTIKTAMQKVLAIKIVDQELFASLERLAAAPGAGEIIGKHLQKVSDDPKLAMLVEDFIISILETCGDPSGK